MTCDHNKPTNKSEFTLLDKEVVVGLLFDSIAKCLLTLKADMISMFPELKDKNDTIIERFYDGEFSHLFQIAVSSSRLAGFLTFHDENTRPIDLIRRKRKKGLGRQIDLGIRLNHSRDRILVIEGKRLHAKTGKQYVSGNTGGICRFKREQHGEELEKACIIGFKEMEGFPYWYNRINIWIVEEQSKSTDLKWNGTEHLSLLEIEEEIFSKCYSTHARLTKPSIELVHFWVNVN